MPKRGGWPEAPAIYQIYPRSFFDTTGNGVGDLRGIYQKLPYVADLGVDAVWLSPFFVSPLIDGGYDISDHCAVDPLYGSIDDFDDLIARAHELGLKVMIDCVLNHTSDQHEWFQAAIAGDEACADRYLWRDPKLDGTPPNNWLSQFGTHGWTFNHKREQYYYHQFLACQPGLNLRNEDVQNEHKRCIKYWRNRGVDGFRFDAVTAYLHDTSFADNPPADAQTRAKVTGPSFSPYTYQDHKYDMLPGDGAAYAENLRAWAGDDAYLIGENTSGNQSFELAMVFTQPGRLDGCYTTDLPENGGKPEIVLDYLKRADPLCSPKWLSSHDQPRHLSHAGDWAERNPTRVAKFYAALMAFLPGAWLIYQGEELALPQPNLSKSDTTDPYDLLYWPDGPGREGARVPMPWNPGQHFGFTDGAPWLPMQWPETCVPRSKDADAIRDFYKLAIKRRRRLKWSMSTVQLVEMSVDDQLVIETSANGKGYRGAFNYGQDAMRVPKGTPVLKSCGTGALGAYEAVITRI